MANPTNMNSTAVPNCTSIQYPAKPGRTISSDTIMMRDAHWYALAAGERSSEGLVTGAARAKPAPMTRSDLPALVANYGKVVTYVSNARSSKSSELMRTVTGMAI